VSLRAARRADEEYGCGAQPDWRGVDWKAATQRIEIGGRLVNVVSLGAGEGPPVVFIHGLGGCWQNWLENLPAVALHRRVVALDLPGFGESEMPEGDVSITNYAACVEALCMSIWSSARWWSWVTRWGASRPASERFAIHSEWSGWCSWMRPGSRSSTCVVSR